MKKHILLTSAIGVALFGAALIASGDVSAASVTVPSATYPGTSAGIQAAINQAGSGDTITISAGTYVLSSAVNITGKNNVTLAGVGNAVLQYSGSGTTVIQMLDSQNITIKNLTIAATNSAVQAVWGTASSGLGINSSCDITLDGLSISGFGRYGIVATRLADGAVHPCPAGNITFKDLTLTGNNRGIHFNNGIGAPNGNILGIVFAGTNTFVAGAFNNGPGLAENFAITTDSDANGGAGMYIFGPGGAMVNIGKVHVSGYADGQILAIGAGGNGRAIVSPDAMLNGRLASSIHPSTLASVFCMLLDTVEEPCPDGTIPNEEGDCEEEPEPCPDGLVMDDEGNCVCPDGSDPDEDGGCPVPCPDGYMPDPNDPDNCIPIPGCPEGYMPDPNNPENCIPIPRPPDTGFMAGTVELIRSNLVLFTGAGLGVVAAALLGMRWAKKFHRIRL